MADLLTIYYMSIFLTAENAKTHLSTKKTERDREISTKFLTHRVSTKSTGNFLQKLFSAHFWRPSQIFALNAKTCLSRKRSEIEQFQQNF